MRANLRNLTRNLNTNRSLLGKGFAFSVIKEIQSLKK